MPSRVAVTYRREDKLIAYEEALRRAGLEPVRFHPEQTRDLAGVQALCITGGTDIDPALYFQSCQPESDQPDMERDRMEAGLLRQAIEADLPVLCICRGLQLLNVVRGGTLVQHLETTGTHRRKDLDAAHGITVEQDTRLAGITGAGAYAVNSRHHQAIDRVGDGLTVAARAEDGVVEAVELGDRRFVIAVQWHPEDRIDTWPRDFALFRALAQAVG